MVNAVRKNPVRGNLQDKDKPPVDAYLFIPYFDGDIGSRPLPTGIIFYLCPNILVNGVAYKGVPLQKGQTFDLSIKICNFGTKVARNVVARIYWANPTVGFLRSQIADNIIAQMQIPVIQTGTTITTTTTPWEITDRIPDHVCLLAEVTNIQDPAPNGIDVALDRHFAQQNLNVIKVTPGQKVLFPLQIAQVTDNNLKFKIQTRPVKGIQLEMLAREIEARPSEIIARDIQLHTYGNIPLTGKQRLSELGRAEVETCELEFAIPENVAPGEFVAVEVIRTDEKNLDKLVGGMVVVAIVG